MKKRLIAWAIPISVFLIGCAGHYGSNRNLPPPNNEPAQTKADLAANDPTVYEKNHRDDEMNVAGKDDKGDDSKNKSLADEVKKAIDDDNVKVETANGVVTLKGRVESQAAKELAASKAQQVAGVTRVENRIEVIPPAGA